MTERNEHVELIWNLLAPYIASEDPPDLSSDDQADILTAGALPQVWGEVLALEKQNDELRRRLVAAEIGSVRVEEDDEIVVGPLFHIERMDEDHLWFRIGLASFNLEVVGPRLRWTSESDADWSPEMIGLVSKKEPGA